MEGAKDVLKIIEYVTVDGGNERFNEETMSNAVNFLISENFKMIEIKFSQGRALFKNLKYD